MNERTFETWLSDQLWMNDEDGELQAISTFEEAGVLTMNRGLVVRFESGAEFQVTINQSAEARRPLLDTSNPLEESIARLRAEAVGPMPEGEPHPARCTCEWDDDGDGESGPRPFLAVHDEACPMHGREADPKGWEEADRFERAQAISTARSLILGGHLSASIGNAGWGVQFISDGPRKGEWIADGHGSEEEALLAAGRKLEAEMCEAMGGEEEQA